MIDGFDVEWCRRLIQSDCGYECFASAELGSHKRPAGCPDIPLDLQGTAFQIKVWEFLLSLKDGDVISYSELAEGIEKPRAVRAAASACAANRVAVLVPCHSILRGDGGLGGYRWELERKRSLLDAERARKARARQQ